MGKTYFISNDGRKVRPTTHDQKKKPAKTKWMGHTSGMHSNGVYDREIVDGKPIYTKSDRAPVKGKDFIKYGYEKGANHVGYPKHIYLAKKRGYDA